MRKSRTVFGAAVAIVAGVLAVLKFPGDVAEIAAAWGSLELQMPPEVVRLVLIAVLGTLAAWGVSPGLAKGIEVVWSRRRERKEAEAERRSRREEAEEHQRRQQEAIRDYLAATLHRSDILAMLVQLLEGPAELDARDARFLQAGGIAKHVSWTGEGYHTLFAVYSLTDVARPLVEDHVAGLLAMMPTPET